jgi:hypothetical protein
LIDYPLAISSPRKTASSVAKKLRFLPETTAFPLDVTKTQSVNALVSSKPHAAHLKGHYRNAVKRGVHRVLMRPRVNETGAAFKTTLAAASHHRSQTCDTSSTVIIPSSDDNG